MKFNFGGFSTAVSISKKIPGLDEIEAALRTAQNAKTLSFNPLIVCDENTGAVADKICGNNSITRVTLKSGENYKTWQSVEAILASAFESGLDRDAVFIAAGGGVISDLTGFAASVYKRGCRLVFVSTTLLGMVDASVGGKTGFDLFGIKNLAGSFYPAENVFIPAECLATLPEKEWKSGMAELIKTAILEGSGDFFNDIELLTKCILQSGYHGAMEMQEGEILQRCIEKAVLYKGSIVTDDPRENGKRMLLNLGHTFGHALESSAGFGNISHGEAVAWGILRACDLGTAAGITPAARAKKIKELIVSLGYEDSCPHPLSNTEDFLFALNKDKKKRNGKLSFIIPDANSACIFVPESENDNKIIEKIINGKNN